MIEALIFDFDGVIIDTETPDYRSWQEVFEERGVELDRSLWAGFIGGAAETFDVYRHLELLAGVRVDRPALRRSRRRRYLDLVESSPVLPGVLDYMQEAKRRGLKLGVASSSSSDWVEGHLLRRDLMRYMDSVRTRDHVAMVKPDPEVYLASIADLGTRPETAVAIEDSANGVTAAKRAGLFCVAVPNQMTRDMPIEHADMRLNALSEIGLAELLELIAEVASR